MKVTDLLGLLAFSDVDVVTDGGSEVANPDDDGPASSALAVLMGVPSKVVGLGWFFRMGGAIRVTVESSLVADLLLLCVEGSSSNLLVLRGGLSPFGVTCSTISGVSFSRLVA